MGSRDEDYKFLQIIDAVASINQKVNLFGIVTETSIPKRSKGTDYFCKLRIVDKSRTSSGISVNFFAEAMHKLPQVQSAGDIIQLSRVVMKSHGSEIFALFNKRFSSFALFEGKHGTSFVPYQVSSKYHAREQDNKHIVTLRKLMVDHRIATVSSDLLMLKEIRTVENFKLVCKILHLCKVQKDEWMLFVWDGTDTPPVAIDAKLEDESENPLPLQLEPFHLPRDVLCTFPAAGTVLRVIIASNENIGINVLKIGRAYNERVSAKWGRMPLMCFPWPSHLTETGYPSVAFVTLRDVLAYPEVTAKFRCAVRVVSIFPWRTEDFVSPSGTYRIRLTLEDPTARIHAFLFADDAVKFFGGYCPVDALARKRNMLLGVKDSYNYRNPPWVQLCLKSYYVNRRDVWGSRNYRVFATRLMDDQLNP